MGSRCSPAVEHTPYDRGCGFESRKVLGFFFFSILLILCLESDPSWRCNTDFPINLNA